MMILSAVDGEMAPSDLHCSDVDDDIVIIDDDIDIDDYYC